LRLQEFGPGFHEGLCTVDLQMSPRACRRSIPAAAKRLQHFLGIAAVLGHRRFDRAALRERQEGLLGMVSMVLGAANALT